MNRFLLIPFEFNQQNFYSLVMCKDKGEMGINYRVTIMNGDLEKILLGNNVIKEVNGFLQVEATQQNGLQDCLKLEITKSLAKILKLPINKPIT